MTENPPDGTEEPTPIAASMATDDIREFFRPEGEIGARLERLVSDLEWLSVQVSERTFADDETERLRLEAAEMLITSALSFLVLGLDQLLADDATPFGASTLAWLRAVRRWSGSGAALSIDDVAAARDVLSKLPTNTRD